MMSRAHVLLGMLVVANLGMGWRVLKVYGEITSQGSTMATMPAAVAALVADVGEDVGANGRIGVLAFAGVSDHAALAELDRVTSIGEVSRTDLVVFTDDPGSVVGRLGSRAVVIPSTQREWLDVVGASSDLQTWAVYDENRIQRATGDFLRGGLVGEVGKLAGVTPDFSAEVLAQALRDEFDPGGLSFVGDVAPPTASHTVLFVGQLMAGCPIERALRTADDAAAVNDVSFTVLVPPTWTDHEIKALKGNLAVRAPVRRAPTGVTEVWQNLASTYGVGSTAGFFVRFRAGAPPEVLTETERVVGIFRGPAE